MRAVMLDWVYEKGKWQQKEKNPEDCTVQSAADVVKCTFTPKLGGQYRVTARIRRTSARTVCAEALGRGRQAAPKRDGEKERRDDPTRGVKAGETRRFFSGSSPRPKAC